MIKKFNKNHVGRDFCVGDIHGCFTDLAAALNRMGFKEHCDRLFSVGDLIDRGPECESALEWLAKPWFHPVRGNHDDYVCRYDTCDTANWIRNGGAWFQGLPSALQWEFAAQFRELPIAIEVETMAGLIGIVHADVPGGDWSKIDGLMRERDSRNEFMWSRDRISFVDESPVAGVAAVIVGHTPLKNVEVLGNVYHIDTAGWMKERGGAFTFINLDTLEALRP